MEVPVLMDASSLWIKNFTHDDTLRPGLRTLSAVEVFPHYFPLTHDWKEEGGAVK